MEFDANIIEELRELARQGTPASQLLQQLKHRLEPNVGRLPAVLYFRQAFFLDLHEATNIGASSIFPEGGWSDAELDRKMAQVMQRTRHLWEAER
jgi:hypothetical protein